MHAEFFRKELECTFVFNGEEIQLFLISPWEKFVAYRERCKVDVYMPCGCGRFASSSALESNIDYSHR